MRGLRFVRVSGLATAWLNGTILKFGSSTVALTMLRFWMSRCSMLKKNDVFLLIAPPMFPLYHMVGWLGGDVPSGTCSNGFRELKAEELPITMICPCSLSVPGLVKISTLPYP